MRYAEVKRFLLAKLKKELPQHLSYHSVEHVKDVINSCKQIAKHENVKGLELKLLLTAALFHDSGFLVNSKNHEQLSCDIARQYLPLYDYDNEQIERICGMIMATKVPQKPHNHLEEIICDADLDYLGREDFFTIGDKLFDELCVYGILNTEDEWNELQVKFLEAHNYFTKTAIQLRKDKKDKHIKMVKSKLGKK
ncbi:MAG: HD domain-containing protein [Chitinophagales bacterium]|nr:HD domain-containing protein [Chitinophagaceae bacterium]MCB9064892.1 HD domain-containing protein [Chitinophagales bacterium]